MKSYDWFKIFNLTEFLNTGLVSRTLSAYLSGYGQKEVTITKGELTSIVYQDVLLPLGLNGKNPFVQNTFAVYKDENEDVYLGIEVP